MRIPTTLRRIAPKLALAALCAMFAACGDDTTGQAGGGQLADQISPEKVAALGLDDPGKADTFTYDVPVDLPELEDPRIVVSLEGLTVELIDEATGFYKVYPAGVGQRGSNGRSWTPTGTFKLHEDPSNNWWFYRRRSDPEYFAGLPFLRFDAQNSRGWNTYGFHGPITETLIRGFVSHGCIRMRGEDIVELFYMVLDHPATEVEIVNDIRTDEAGEVVDITPAERDPVAHYRQLIADCEEDDREDGETLLPGEYDDLSLCDRRDTFVIPAAAGEVIQVVARSERPIALTLSTDEADAHAPAEPAGWFSSGYDTLVELAVETDGAVLLEVEGQPGSGAYGLIVERLTP